MYMRFGVATLAVTISLAGCGSSSSQGPGVTTCSSSVAAVVNGSTIPLGSCDGTIGVPLSNPQRPADQGRETSPIKLKVGEDVKLILSQSIADGLISGIDSSNPSILSITSGRNGLTMGIFHSLEPGVAQITVNPTQACGNDNGRCLIATVDVTGK